MRLNTEEVGVVTAEHPSDPFRPHVKIVCNEKGERLEEPFLVNTWERDTRGEYPRASSGRSIRIRWKSIR